MKNLVESIAVKDGNILNLEWHEFRYHKSYTEYFGHKPSLRLMENLDIELPKSGYHKLRIEYNSNEKNFDVQPYQPKSINTLKVVEDNAIEYHLKYADRMALNILFELRDGCDDILIIKNELVTDTFAGNIVFYDGQQWVTPNSPLLEGTSRNSLLDRGYLVEKEIRRDDISRYRGFQVINAMRPFIEDSFTDIENIKF